MQIGCTVRRRSAARNFCGQHVPIGRNKCAHAENVPSETSFVGEPVKRLEVLHCYATQGKTGEATQHGPISLLETDDRRVVSTCLCILMPVVV